MSPEEVLQLLGGDVRVLAEPRRPGIDGDLDCAVSGSDPTWPLRLIGGWRLCHSLRHDVRCRYWILERNGEVFTIDALDDPHGLGRDAFPTQLAFGAAGPMAPPGVRAAYLVAKRVRKGDWSETAWQEIGVLATATPDGFREALPAVVGRRAAREVGETALRGEPPVPALRQRLRRARRLRHLRHPLRGLLVAVLSTGRMAGRIFMPTGLLVVVAGPDGTGKSTLSRRLPDACGRLFRRSRVLHGRPGLFPRPGALLGKAEPDSTQPHARPPHGRAISSGLLVYYWLDALLGGMLRIWSFRARSGLVVLERGWWDLLVDPRRYRLDPPERLVRLLGRLLPRPDLLLLLDVPATTLAARTNELPQTELARQASV